MMREGGREGGREERNGLSTRRRQSSFSTKKGHNIIIASKSGRRIAIAVFKRLVRAWNRATERPKDILNVCVCEGGGG
jgi:hypothetical protein